MTATELYAPLAVDAIRRVRTGTRIGHTIHYFDSVDSTNTVAHQLARDGAAEGTVVIAEAQTKGRGRLGRAWVSPPFRNLYMSLILRPPLAATDAPPLALVVGLATTETVREWATGAMLKWPNDVVVDGRKISGILTEMDADQERVRFVIPGIGVNLNIAADDFPLELRDKATSIMSVTSVAVDRAAFAARLLAQLEDRYALFIDGGFVAVRPLCDRLSSLNGRHVLIDDGGHRYEGLVSGLADDGSLCLRTSTGREMRVVAGEVTVVGGYASKVQ